MSKVIKEYNSDCNLDYATVQKTFGSIYLVTADFLQAKTHLKRAFKVYEKIWADEPEMIEKKGNTGIISTDWILHWKNSIRSFNIIRAI